MSVRTLKFDVHAWRRIILATLVALIALLAVSVTTPRSAHAIVDPSIVWSSQTGWVQTVDNRASGTCGMYSYYSTGVWRPCHIDAWSWNGGAWQYLPLPPGIQVYVSPYASGWHWAWTQRTGWVAVRTSDLTSGYSCTGFGCPVF